MKEEIPEKTNFFIQWFMDNSFIDIATCFAIVVTAVATFALAIFAYEAKQSLIKPIEVQLKLKELDDLDLLVDEYCVEIIKINKLYEDEFILHITNIDFNNEISSLYSKIDRLAIKIDQLYNKNNYLVSDFIHELKIKEVKDGEDGEYEQYNYRFNDLFTKIYEVRKQFMMEKISEIVSMGDAQYEQDSIKQLDHTYIIVEEIIIHRYNLMSKWIQFKKQETNKILGIKEKSQSQPTKPI